MSVCTQVLAARPLLFRELKQEEAKRRDNPFNVQTTYSPHGPQHTRPRARQNLHSYPNVIKRPLRSRIRSESRERKRPLPDLNLFQWVNAETNLFREHNWKQVFRLCVKPDPRPHGSRQDGMSCHQQIPT